MRKLLLPVTAVLLVPPPAVPGADEFIKIAVVVVLCLFVVAVINYPRFHIPATWALYGTWIVVAAMLIFLVYEVLVNITHIL